MIGETLALEHVPHRLVKLGSYSFCVPPGVRGQDAIRVADPVLSGDEYQLLPIQRDGHQVHVAVDVGANCGAFLVRTADLFPGVKLIAFEPDPDSAAICRLNTRDLQAELVLFEAAVLGAGAPPSCSFWRFFQEPASNCAVQDHNIGLDWVPRVQQTETIRVRSVRLPDVLTAAGIMGIDILKLDCEGAEALILEDLAATGWLDKTRWVRFEWHGRQSLARCMAALEPTHVAWAEQWPQRNGFGLAHSCKDE